MESGILTSDFTTLVSDFGFVLNTEGRLPESKVEYGRQNPLNSRFSIQYSEF